MEVMGDGEEGGKRFSGGIGLVVVEWRDVEKGTGSGRYGEDVGG